MSETKKREIFFEQLKEARDGYFVEYNPPGGEVRFAWLTLVFQEGATPDFAKTAMEHEAALWTLRYPVPVMVFACDEKGDTVEIGEDWGRNNLIAWRCSEGSLDMHWELLKDEVILDVALSAEYLLKTYEGVPYRTAEEVRQQADANWKSRSKELRIGFAIIFCWAVAVPAAVALLGWTSPLVGFMVMVYALGKAARQAGLMLGWFKPLPHESEKRQKEQRMRHYYYHCERNPDAFRRLVVENFEQDQRAEIQREAEELTSASSGRG